MSEPGSDTSQKRGEQIAQELEVRIVRGGWQVGHRLGTEDDLARQFGVSRSVMREAIAIAELDGFVGSHRGQNGGLFVSSAAQVTRIATLRHYLALAGSKPADINEMRFTLEAKVCALAMSGISISDAARLRQLAVVPPGEAPEELAQHTNAMLYEILRIAANPALSLFTMALAQCNIDIALWNGADEHDILDLTRAVWSFRLRQVEAIIGADQAGVLEMQRAIVDAGLAMHGRFRSPPETVDLALCRLSLLGLRYPLVGRLKVAKKPEAVARLIAQQVVEGDLLPGARLGSEPELVAKYEVSRGVLREAVRWLERHGVAKVMRGKDGGLHVVSPNPSAVARSSSLYLVSSFSCQTSDFTDVIQLQHLAAVDRAARGARMAPPPVSDGADEAQAISREERPSISAQYHALSRQLRKDAGSSVIDCLVSTMMFAIRLPNEDRPGGNVNTQLHRHRDEMFNAIGRGDAAWAKRHLLQIESLVRSAGPELLSANEIVDRGALLRPD